MPHRSRLCAVIIDGPKDSNEQSVQFWSGALGRHAPAKSDPDSPYTTLETPEGEQLDLFVQAIGSGESRLHLDIETDDVDAEVRRLEGLGASVKEKLDGLCIMEAPSGHIFCVVPVQSKAWPNGAIEWSD